MQGADDHALSHSHKCMRDEHKRMHTYVPHTAASEMELTQQILMYSPVYNVTSGKIDPHHAA